MSATTDAIGRWLQVKSSLLSEYIQHHLTFFQKPIGEGGFWTVNVDSVLVGVLLGVVGIGFLWWVVRGATSGVPNKRQAFVELLFDFIDEQVKGVFHHGDRNRFVAPLALTVFVWVVLMNAMDFLPADLVALATHNVSEHGFRHVPTADVNTTFALALSVWVLMIGFAISAKGLGGFIHELFCAPFGSTRCSRQIPLQLRGVLVEAAVAFAALFGNMYAGEILFLLCGCGRQPAWWEPSLAAARPRLGHLPHSDRAAAGLHFHDAHRGLPSMAHEHH